MKTIKATPETVEASGIGGFLATSFEVKRSRDKRNKERTVEVLLKQKEEE